MSIWKALPAVILAVAVVAAWLLLRDWLSFDALAQARGDLIAWRDEGYALAALGYVLVYAAAVAVSLPGALFLTLAGGFTFGALAGALLTVTGATLGAVALFSIVRLGFGASLAARMDANDGQVGRIKRGLDENQWSMLFLMRLVPVVPFFLANLLPAFLGVPLRRYVISTFLGILPGSLVYSSVGAGLGATFDAGGTPDLTIFFEPYIIGPILGLCLLAALPIILKAWQGRERVE